MIPRLPICLSTVLCQVSFDLPPSTRRNPVRIPTTDLQSFSRKDFHVYSAEFLSSQDLVHWIPTSDTLARVSGTPRKETQETSPDFTTTVFNQVLPRLFIKRHKHPFFHSLSHDNAHFRLSCSLKPPYPSTEYFTV